MTTENFWRDRSNVLWEVIEGDWTRPIRVRRIVEDGSIPEGVQTVILFNPDGPVQIGVALTHPTRAWLTQRKAGVQATITDLTTRANALRTQSANIRPADGAPLTFTSVRNRRISDELLDRAVAFEAQRDQLQASLAESDEVIAAQSADVNNLKSLDQINAAIAARNP